MQYDNTLEDDIAVEMQSLLKGVCYDPVEANYIGNATPR